MAWLAVAGMLLAVFAHYGQSAFRNQNSSDPAAAPPEIAVVEDPLAAIDPENRKTVTFVGPVAQWMRDGNTAESVPETTGMAIMGPLARWMDDRNAANSASEAPRARSTRSRGYDEPLPAATVVAHKTFFISNTVDFPFEIPPHAFNPQLRGNYKSFTTRRNVHSGDRRGDVSFILLNQQQFDTFVKEGSSETLMNLDASNAQEVNFGLPASGDDPVKYYLVFCSDPHEGKKIVQADFQVRF